MGVVLAIDPGRRQGKALDRLTQEFQDHEVVIATSGDEALAVLDGLVPDLVMFPLFMAPGDEAKLQSRLDGLGSAGEMSALTIPLRAFFEWETHATRPTAVPPRWFYWFKPIVGLAPELSAPKAFAAAVRGAVNRPPARVEGADAQPAPAPAASPASSSGQDSSIHASSGRASSGHASSGHASTISPGTFVAPAAPAPVQTVASPASAVSLPPQTPLVVPPPAAAPASTSASAPVFSSVQDSRPVAHAGAFGRGDVRQHEIAPDEDDDHGGLSAGLASRVGAVLSALWRTARDLPRPLQAGLSVVAIVLTLGVTGNLAPLLSLPGRVAGATKQRFFPDAPKTGTAEIQTVPDGAQVWYQGRQLGVTPLRTEFAIGAHEIELRYRNTTRTVMLDITPGNTFVQRVEWGAPRVTGKLRVESDPPGAAVAIDGRPRGVTPLNVDDLTVGKHLVDVSSNGNTVHESVEVKAAKTATVRTSIYQGWLALFSPIDVRVALDGRPLTLDDQGRAMVPSGAHQLTVQNRALGYSETRTVEIKPGDTTPFSVVLPKTSLSIATSSPAEVWVDGEPAGATPVTNFPVDIGTREVLVRSAEHGERRATVTATVNPVSVAIDFTSSAP